MKDNKLSIIVPCYNAERYLKVLFECLFKTEHNDVEFIFINDGSTDNTKEKLTDYEWCEKVKVIDLPNNKGISAARNFGLEKATGKFVWFIDADDLLPDDAIDNILSSIQKYDECDLLIFDYEKSKNNSIESVFLPIYENIGNDDLFFLLNDKQLAYQLWNKVFKRNTIKRNFNTSLCILEDMDFLLNLIEDVDLKVRLLNHKIYNYFIHENSTIHSVNKIKLNNMNDMFDRLCILLSKSEDRRFVPIQKIKIIEHVYFLMKNKDYSKVGLLKKIWLLDKDIVLKDKVKIIIILLNYFFESNNEK